MNTTHQASAPADSGRVASVPDNLTTAEEGSLHALVLHSLDEDQAIDVVSIPLEGKSSIADFMVIASGRSTRQVAAIAQKLGERVKQGGFGPARICLLYTSDAADE